MVVYLGRCTKLIVMYFLEHSEILEYSDTEALEEMPAGKKFQHSF